MQNMRFVLLTACLVFSCAVAVTITDNLRDLDKIDTLNQKLYPLITEITEKIYFRLFKVNLNRKCTIWDTQLMCFKPGCSVCECEPDEIWKNEEMRTSVDRSLKHEFSSVKWEEFDNNWIIQDDDEEMIYIDLVKNPEGHTGYVGEDPRRIWAAIYNQNCFTQEQGNMCLEERVFFRVLSAIQSCISAHVSYRYPVENEDTGNPLIETKEETELAPNLQLFDWILAKHPDRIHNLYFAYILLLRAMNKASSYLADYKYSTGDMTADLETNRLMNDLLFSNGMQTECDDVFDESQLFRQGTEDRKEEFRNHFRNISLIMDCVGCEKCKLHGKLQILGIGTALKILFNEEPLELHRNEVVALVNSLHKFATAISMVREMQQLMGTPSPPQPHPDVTPEDTSSLYDFDIAKVVIALAISALVIFRLNTDFKTKTD